MVRENNEDNDDYDDEYYEDDKAGDEREKRKWHNKKDKRKKKRDKRSASGYPFKFPPFDSEEEEEEFYDQMERIFGEFGKQFMKSFKGLDLNKMMMDIFKKMNLDINNISNIKPLTPDEFQKMIKDNVQNPNIKGPFVFGINMRLGPNGPVIDSFGNIKPKEFGETEISEVREPLTDVIEEEDHVLVVCEVPGVTKENIELKATETSLTVIAKDENNRPKFKTTVDLPCRINPDHAKARYQNGILEIKLKKLDQGNAKKITIE